MTCCRGRCPLPSRLGRIITNHSKRKNPSTAMKIITYILNSLLQSGIFLGIILLPCIVLLVLSQFCSNFMRTRIARAISVKRFIYITAIGTVIHECGHAVFCILFRHKIQKINFFSPSEDGTLGSVTYSYNKKASIRRSASSSSGPDRSGSDFSSFSSFPGCCCRPASRIRARRVLPESRSLQATSSALRSGANGRPGYGFTCRFPSRPISR